MLARAAVWGARPSVLRGPGVGGAVQKAGAQEAVSSPGRPG